MYKSVHLPINQVLDEVQRGMACNKKACSAAGAAFKADSALETP
jgi:hypothetical protein